METIVPREGEHPETVKDYTSEKITRVCKIMTKLDGRKCYRYYAIDTAIDLLLKKLDRKSSSR